MEGRYRIYQDNELVLETPNIITDGGRSILLRYLASQLPAWASVIAVGSHPIAATATDRKLGFEFSGGGINLRAPDFPNNQIVFKASLPLNDSGSIYELGLYPQESANALGTVNRVISAFDSTLENLTGGTADTTNYRVGSQSYGVAPIASASGTILLSSVRGDYSHYGDNDTFSLAFFLNDANTANIVVRMRQDVANYYGVTLSGLGTTAGYFVRDIRKADFVATGAPNWSSITDIEFIVTAGAGGATSVQLDGFRVNTAEIFADFALVSRSVLASPVKKMPGQQLDIEYVLGFST